MELFLIVEGGSRYILSEVLIVDIWTMPKYHFECVILARNIISQQIKTLEY